MTGGDAIWYTVRSVRIKQFTYVPTLESISAKDVTCMRLRNGFNELSPSTEW